MIIAQSVLVLRSLLRSPRFPKATSRAAIIGTLVVLLEAGRIKAPTARATVYWLVGQFADEGFVESLGPDLVRTGAKGFAEEVRVLLSYTHERSLTLHTHSPTRANCNSSPSRPNSSSSRTSPLSPLISAPSPSCSPTSPL